MSTTFFILPSQGFGTIGSVPPMQPPPGLPGLPSHGDASQMQDAIENLNKKLMGLTKSNSDLLQQLGEREKQVQKLGSLLAQVCHITSLVNSHLFKSI